jgi:hypothetical protein
MDQPKVGAGSFAAFLRQGALALGTAAAKPLPESIQVDVPGQMFQPVPQQVWQEKQRDTQKTDPESEMDR